MVHGLFYKKFVFSHNREFRISAKLLKTLHLKQGSVTLLEQILIQVLIIESGLLKFCFCLRMTNIYGPPYTREQDGRRLVALVLKLLQCLGIKLSACLIYDLV